MDHGLGGGRTCPEADEHCLHCGARGADAIYRIWKCPKSDDVMPLALPNCWSAVSLRTSCLGFLAPSPLHPVPTLPLLSLMILAMVASAEHRGSFCKSVPLSQNCYDQKN